MADLIFLPDLHGAYGWSGGKQTTQRGLIVWIVPRTGNRFNQTGRQTGFLSKGFQGAIGG
jgi:hypothetical protein